MDEFEVGITSSLHRSKESSGNDESEASDNRLVQCFLPQKRNNLRSQQKVTSDFGDYWGKLKLCVPDTANNETHSQTQQLGS